MFYFKHTHQTKRIVWERSRVKHRLIKSNPYLIIFTVLTNVYAHIPWLMYIYTCHLIIQTKGTSRNTFSKRYFLLVPHKNRVLYWFWTGSCLDIALALPSICSTASPHTLKHKYLILLYLTYMCFLAKMPASFCFTNRSRTNIQS